MHVEKVCQNVAAPLRPFNSAHVFKLFLGKPMNPVCVLLDWLIGLDVLDVPSFQLAVNDKDCCDLERVIV